MADEYKRFLDAGKTEREFVQVSIESVEQLGCVDIASVSALSAGQKVYQSIKGKGLMLAVIGRKPITEGMNIPGSHRFAAS